MTFPKKNTHTVSLRNGQAFQWHLNSDWDSKNRWIVITEQGANGQLLFVNPNHHNFIPGQATVREAIRTGFRLGWTPAERKAPLRLEYNGESFVLITSRLENSLPASTEPRYEG